MQAMVSFIGSAAEKQVRRNTKKTIDNFLIIFKDNQYLIEQIKGQNDNSKCIYYLYYKQAKESTEKMIKIKSDTNQKLLQNFSNEIYPDITIITQSRKYSLTLAYLVIDSQFFNQLPADQAEVDLSNLPQKPLVQVLRALYGDQLIAYSISELQSLYNIIDFLKIQEYKISIAEEINNNKNLMENLQILQFCTKYNLIAEQVKRLHINNKLRALENNKNFLMLNKISKQTLKPLLLSFHSEVQESGASIINNILENYFNRNNIKPVDFFQENYDVEVLINIWEQFHHILHIERKPKPFYNTQEERMSDLLKRSGIEKSKGQSELKKLKDQQNKISELKSRIEQQDKIISKYRIQLLSLKQQGQQLSTRRIPSNPVLPTIDNEDQTSLIYLSTDKIPKNPLLMKNIKSQYSSQNQSPSTGSSKFITNSKLNYDL